MVVRRLSESGALEGCTALSDDRELHDPGVYQIRVRGELDEKWSEWFGGMSITHHAASDGSPSTTLTGPVADQSALRGILSKVWDLNLTLVSLDQIEKGYE